MSEFTQHKVIVVFTDPGNEIDDEILMHLLMTQETKGNDVYFVCVPGATNKDPEEEVSERIQRVRTIFPDQFGGSKNSYVCDPNDATSSIFTLCSYDHFIENLHVPFKIHTLLHVAPLWHIQASSLEIFDIDTRIFMGDLTHPEKSINATKAMNSDVQIKMYEAQESVFQKICKKTIDIPTHFARQVPTPVDFIQKLPNTMKDVLLNTAFAQFVGRPDPKFPWAKDISVANHATILNMLSADVMYDILVRGGVNSVDKVNNDKIEFLVSGFLPKDCDDMSYKTRLIQIAQAVFVITKVPYQIFGDNEMPCFQETMLENKEMAKQNWCTYIEKHQCDLTPFYDGLAWVVMKQHQLPSVQDCKALIKQL